MARSEPSARDAATWWSWLPASITGPFLDGSPAVRWGRGLLLSTGVVVTAALPLLRPGAADLRVVLLISVAMSAMLLFSLKAPWDRWPIRATLCFPIAVLLALASLGHFARANVGSCFLGVFTLCFAYIGVTQRRHTAFAVLPLAVPAYVATAGAWNPAVAIRLVVGVAVWTLLAEVLASLTVQQHLVELALEHAARTDELTRLANRRELDRRLIRLRSQDSVVMCDLDHFKLLNDAHGHAAGDVVLRDFGAVLLGCLRGDDLAARYGGEEFVLVLAETDAAQTHDVLVRLRRRWQEAHPELTFSAGYSLRKDATPQDCLEAADKAMYAAKQAGRDCFRQGQLNPAAPVDAL